MHFCESIFAGRIYGNTKCYGFPEVGDPEIYD